MSHHIHDVFKQYFRFDILIVMAPAMVYKASTLVCGHSIEVNLISDVELDLSLGQIKLMFSLTNELFTIFESDASPQRRSRITFPYLKPESGNDMESDAERDLVGGFDSSDFATRDSGIEIPSTSVKSKVRRMEVNGICVVLS